MATGRAGICLTKFNFQSLQEEIYSDKKVTKMPLIGSIQEEKSLIQNLGKLHQIATLSKPKLRTFFEEFPC